MTLTGKSLATTEAPLALGTGHDGTFFYCSGHCVKHCEHWTDCLFSDCKNYSENSGLKFWVTNANKYPLLAPLAQDLLSAPASEAYVERVFSFCGQLTAGKRHRLTERIEKRISRLWANIPGSSSW